ncbi:hypothetical protein quinque_014343 [Culex quinquefasciatus]
MFWHLDRITNVGCRTPEQIKRSYKPRIFERSASVLNMIRQIVGNFSWQKVVGSFLKNHQLATVVPRNLYMELEQVTARSELLPKNISIEKIMNTWMMNYRVPELTVERRYNDNTITITQTQMDRDISTESKRHFGLYRINYDEQNWKLLARALQSNISCMPRENRAQLLSDAFYFHEKGQLNKSVLFELLTFLSHETESLVLQS